MVPEQEKRIEEKGNVSNRISETVRFIGFGLVAAFYTIQSTDNESLRSVPDDFFYLFVSIGIFGVATIVFDYLQYLAGYFSVNDALKREADEFAYDVTTSAYRLRTRFFWAKQVSAGLGALALSITIISNLWL
ncbi:MAG: hypothetical protein AAF317_14320 [Pseudomonadota bacterium]